MPLRDQPYLPLYVDRFINDENLRECSPAANGIHIRLMCLLHKADTEVYGTIILKKEYRKEYEIEFKPLAKKNLPESFAQANAKQDAQASAEQHALLLAKQFAKQFDKQFPYHLHDIEKGLIELYENNVIFFHGLYLCQNGMIKQGKITEKRSAAGKVGGDKRIKNEKKKLTKLEKMLLEKEKEAKSFAQANAKQDAQANSINITISKTIDELIEEEGLSNNTEGVVGETKKTRGRKKKNEEQINSEIVNSNNRNVSYEQRSRFTNSTKVGRSI